VMWQKKKCLWEENWT